MAKYYRLYLVISIILLYGMLSAQSLIGAWEGHHTSETGTPLHSVLIIADGYQVITTYDSLTGKFIHTNGGSWQLDGSLMTEIVEFDSQDPDRVGEIVQFKIILGDSSLSIVGSDRVMKRVDDGSPGALQGAWLMSGRVRDGQTQNRDVNRPRKTMKILSGTRFQWIAYNTETKEFKGTGGGTYTTIDQQYTESIAFFSKDETRVGKSLQFDYELRDGDWHHSGLSSKGAPIYEIWSKRTD